VLRREHIWKSPVRECERRFLGDSSTFELAFLARELCLLVRTNRVALNPEDVRECCLFISKLCEEAGCKEPSDLCRKAAEAVLTDEEKYLELCRQSCMKCGESRRPRREAARRTYVV